jgi:hypothetical protein
VQTQRDISRAQQGTEIKHTGIRGQSLEGNRDTNSEGGIHYIYNCAGILVKQCSGASTDGS